MKICKKIFLMLAVIIITLSTAGIVHAETEGDISNVIIFARFSDDNQRQRIAVFLLFDSILALSVTCGDTLPLSGTYVPPPPAGGVFQRERPWQSGKQQLFFER